MASLNRCDLIGNIGKDPELRHMPDGRAACTLSLATTEKWTSSNGARKERTEWHRVVCYDKLAELASECLQSGSEVFFSGSLRTRSYDDKEGITRHSTEIVAQRMILLNRSRRPAPTFANTHPYDHPDSAPAETAEASPASRVQR